jgi:dinuclear metal center YbgI/SA1388 family protein
MISCQTVVQIIEKLAPKRLALEWDSPGLALGDFSKKISKILLALTVTPEVIDYAADNGFDMVVSHHPLLFKPLKSLRWDLPSGKIIYRAIKHDIAVYSAHTNLDVAQEGVNDLLARVLELENVSVLKETEREELKKIVVFVPRGYEEAVRTAMGDAGAGFIGNYSHCSFNVEGVGIFKPLEGTNPFIGKVGSLERVEETRIETVVPESLVKKVISAMLKVHPYEEVAYDIYPVENAGKTFGLGRLGYLKNSMALRDFCEVVKRKLQAGFLRVVGDLSREVSKVALCGGAGGDLVSAAAFLGADVLVTGDVKYHDAEEAKAFGLAVVDAGHFSTENLMMGVLADFLAREIALLGEKIEIKVYPAEDPFRIL